MFASQPSPEEATASAFHRYRIYGLDLRSELPLPDLHEEHDVGDPDIDVRLGSVPPSEVEGVTFTPEGAILQIAEVARFLIREGRTIVVDPKPGASSRNIRIFLLGSAMGVLLHQRGLLPLHANAIEIDGKAIAVLGESGAGKSTLAAWLHDAGHRVVADDVCVVRADGNSSRVLPGLPRIRLWRDALERTGRATGDYEFSYAGDETYEKFDIPVARDMTVDDELELAAIYLLSSGEEFGVRQLNGIEAVDAIFSHTYRGFVVAEIGSNRLHFDASVKVVQSTPIFEFERSRDLGAMAQDVPRVLEHARRLIAS